MDIPRRNAIAIISSVTKYIILYHSYTHHIIITWNTNLMTLWRANDECLVASNKTYPTKKKKKNACFIISLSRVRDYPQTHVLIDNLVVFAKENRVGSLKVRIFKTSLRLRKMHCCLLYTCNALNVYRKRIILY